MYYDSIAMLAVVTFAGCVKGSDVKAELPPSVELFEVDPEGWFVMTTNVEQQLHVRWNVDNAPSGVEVAVKPDGGPNTEFTTSTGDETVPVSASGVAVLTVNVPEHPEIKVQKRIGRIGNSNGLSSVWFRRRSS